MIVLRLADGSLLILLPDGRAVRVERDGALKTAVDALTAPTPRRAIPKRKHDADDDVGRCGSLK